MARWRRVCFRVALCAASMCVDVAPARAADIYVPAGASLQAAIDTAQPGDRLLLAPGATYTGNFRLTDKGPSTAYITIRSAAADTLLPLDHARITPSDAAWLPVIKSPNTMSALTAAAGAHHWRLQLLEFQANDRGYGDIIALGAGDMTQTSLTQVPHDLVLDRLYIHGDPVIGQKRGVSLHSGATWVLNCYIADMKGVGMDTQAISGYNGPGPYTIVNNYLEAAGENFLLGGASPKIPSVIPSDIEFASNHLYKPLSWRSPILTAPAGVSAAASGSGALPAGTYSYRVVAARKTAQDAWAYSDRSAEVTAPVGAGGRVVVAWAPVANAATYRVYRGSAPGAQDRYFETTGATFVDTGSMAGVADTGASIKGTLWTVKNIFELKLGSRVRVRGNLMENCWKESQAGFAVLFTPRNQDATSPWIYVRDVEFTGNLVRHAGSGVQIEGYDTNATSAQSRRITIAHNIFDDIDSTRWGGSGRWMQIGNAPSDITVDHNTVVHNSQAIYVYGGSYGAELQSPNLRFTNNLLQHNAYGIMGDGRGYGNDTLAAYFPGAVVSRNTLAGGPASRYPSGNEFPTVAFWQAQFAGLSASDFRLVEASPYRLSGTDGLDLGARVDQVEADALAARNGRFGPPPPLAITTTALPDGQTGVSYAVTLAATGGNGTYIWMTTGGALPPGVTLDPAMGTLGGTPKRPGSFAVTLRAADATNPDNAASQSFEMSIASTPPAVSLVSPASRTTIVGTDVALVASASDTDGSVTRVDFYANERVLGSASAAPWSFAWPNVAPGTYRLTAVATDDSGLAATSEAVDVGVVAPVAIMTASAAPGQTGTAYAVTLEACGGTGTYGWALAAGQLPAGLGLDASSGVIAGTPSQPGTFSFTVRVEDASDAANAATRTYVLAISSTPPQVAITSPATGASIVGSTVSLAASASDADGSVVRVDFFAGSALVGSATAFPWTYTWTNVAPGAYRLTAVATDNSGLTATCAAVTATVTATVTLPPGTALPGTVQAEDFDGGGEGVGYHDSTVGNAGGAYRVSDVDVEPTTDAGGGYNVGWITAGEWLKYTVTVAKAGTYTLAVRVASKADGGTFHLEFGGSDKTGAMIIPNTGGKQAWVTLRKVVTLAAGAQTMRLVLDANGPNGIFGNVNYVSVEPVVGTMLPGRVQAEDFDGGGEGVGYHDTTAGNTGGAYRATDVDLEPTTDAGGGHNVGWMVAGEWLKYSVTVATSGTYTVSVRVAAKAAGGTFHIEFGGVNKTGPLKIPNTGSYQTWTTLTKKVTLAAGAQIMRLVLDAPGTTGVFGNVNHITITAVP